VPKVDVHQFAEFFETLEQACVRSAATEMWTLVVLAVGTARCGPIPTQQRRRL